MSALLETNSANELIDHWWHLASTLALECPMEIRQAWQNRITEVIHYYRLTCHSSASPDREPFAVMCQISLAHSRLDLAGLLLDGYISLPEMKALYTLGQDLENTLAA